jgi:hypothetical protein
LLEMPHRAWGANGLFHLPFLATCELSGAGFSLRGLVISRFKTHRLKPVLLKK